MSRIRQITLTRNGQEHPRDIEVSCMKANGLAVGDGVMLGIKGDCCPQGSYYAHYTVTSIEPSDRFGGGRSDITFKLGDVAVAPEPAAVEVVSVPEPVKPAPTPQVDDTAVARQLTAIYRQVGEQKSRMIRAVVHFGVRLTEWETYLGRCQGRDGAGLRVWLESNCPEINYNTAMGYKSLAAKAIEMLGGGAMAVAALSGRTTTRTPDGECIDVDEGVIERREEMFRCADSRRKFEQLYFDFAQERGERRAGRPQGSVKRYAGCEEELKSPAVSARIAWSKVIEPAGARSLISMASLLSVEDAKSAIAVLEPLVRALKRRMGE